MYSSRPSVIYGFHGTDEQIAMAILTHKKNFHSSTNIYDWLGPGIYFWENNKKRAHQFAEESSKRKKSRIKDPFVLGSILELGHCLDLLDQNTNAFLAEAYQRLTTDMEKEGLELPTNHPFSGKDFDFKSRDLDCAVIQYACSLAKKEGVPFDSVRAAFIEGAPLYPGAKFYTENHIQLAIINPRCIKGIFIPMNDDTDYVLGNLTVG
jgi:hypothetical protein